MKPIGAWLVTYIMELRAIHDIHRRHTAEKPDTKSIGIDYPVLYSDYLTRDWHRDDGGDNGSRYMAGS